MSKGLASLRRYQIGGGIGGPEDEWMERMIRQLQRRGPIYPNVSSDNPLRVGWARWWNEDPLHGLPPAFRSIRDDPHLLDPLRIWRAENLDFLGKIAERGPRPYGYFEDIQNLPYGGGLGDRKAYHTLSPSIDEAIEDLIGLSNLDIDFDERGMDIRPAPLPHARPPLSDKPALWEDLRSMGIVPEDLIEGPSDILDQPVHDLDEAFRNNQVDDLIRGAGGEPPLSAALQREADIASLTGSDIWNVDDRYKSKLPAYSLFDSPHRSGIGSLLNRLTSSSIPWGSIAAPLLAAAVSPAALAAETAFDFAISPEPLGGTASEVPGAGRTWRESPHIDPSDEEVASWMQTLLGDSPYSQSQLARPSTTSQRAIEQLIRNARVGTPVNRYRR